MNTVEEKKVWPILTDEKKTLIDEKMYLKRNHHFYGSKKKPLENGSPIFWECLSGLPYLTDIEMKIFEIIALNKSVVVSS